MYKKAYNYCIQDSNRILLKLTDRGINLAAKFKIGRHDMMTPPTQSLFHKKAQLTKVRLLSYLLYRILCGFIVNDVNVVRY